MTSEQMYSTQQLWRQLQGFAKEYQKFKDPEALALQLMVTGDRIVEKEFGIGSIDPELGKAKQMYNDLVPYVNTYVQLKPFV